MTYPCLARPHQHDNIRKSQRINTEGVPAGEWHLGYFFPTDYQMREIYKPVAPVLQLAWEASR